jgi:hypothetical protein
MIDKEYTELNKADSLNRLAFLAQLWKDRANDESLDTYERRRAEEYPFTICIITSGDLASLELSMTKAKQLIRESWHRMEREVEQYEESENWVSAVPTMSFSLSMYGLMWLSARLDKTPSPELQAKWDAIEATRREQFPTIYEEEE